MAGYPIYQVYAELQNFEPKTWRRFQIMNNATIAKLAYTLMTLFEMEASHLYVFEVEEKYHKISQYGCIFEDEEDMSQLNKYKKIKDAKDIRLKDILNEKNKTMIFRYDFGDNWTFNIVLEKIFKDKQINGNNLPRVLEGEGFGIIEDCGGTMGLDDIKKAYEIKKGEDYELYSNWLGVNDFDFSKCDLDDLNFRLKRLPRIFKNCYELNIEPTVYSIKILERDYMKKKERKQ